MTNEPLTKEKRRSIPIFDIETQRNTDNIPAYEKESVKSAFDWLKQELIFSKNHNLECSEGAFNEIMETINEAFPDLYPKGSDNSGLKKDRKYDRLGTLH